MDQEKINLKDIEELIVRFLTYEITDEENEILSELITGDREIKKLFDEMVSVWQYAGTLKSSSEEEAREMFKRLELRIAKSSELLKEFESGISGAGFIKISRKWLSVAAAILLAFLTGGMTYYLVFSGKQQLHLNPETSQVSTPYGTRSDLLLSDGTMVWLNAGSILTYNENYNIQSREVNLAGEACFKVAKDQKRPFIVKSGGLQIRALGTVFNVKAYPDDSTLIATLIEGSIVVEGKSVEKGTFSYSLEPKQNDRRGLFLQGLSLSGFSKLIRRCSDYRLYL
jgi:transmembrane sensor